MRIVRVDEAGAARVAQAQTWPFTGRTGSGAEAPRPGAGGEDDACRARSSLPSPSSRRRDAVARPTRHARALAAGASTASGSAATSRRGSTARSPGTSSASRTVGASAGSARRAWLGRSRSTARPSFCAVGVELLELLGLVAVAGDDEGAGAAQPGVAAGGLAELGAEGREARGGAQAQVEQRPLAELRLGDRGEHAGGVAPRAVLAGVEHDRAQAALRRAPRDGEADDAAADDGYVVLLGLRRHCGRTLPTPASPGSGSTVGGLCAALSARSAGSRDGPES